MTVKAQGKTFEFFEDEAREVMKQLFGQMKRNDIINTLERNDLPTDDKTVDHIAENLFEEIMERDDMYWELEDKNILYLAGKMGIA